MSPFRRKSEPTPSIPSRRPHPGLLRRERRALLKARDERLRDLGGLVVEMYRRPLPDGPPRRCLNRLLNRLTKILSEIRKLHTPQK